MESPTHSLTNLFGQLGLASNEQAIDDFVEQHKPLPQDTPLHQAEFWTNSQAAFLQEAIDEDADWSEIVDHLDAMLR